MRRLNPEPNHVLGPLYYLANADKSDDWIGYIQLALLGPCLLPVLIRPNRWTALLASLAICAWLSPVFFATPQWFDEGLQHAPSSTSVSIFR
jgi:hypothetical protein